MKKGSLTVIAGPMFSGKTGKLVAMVDVFTKLKLVVLTIKPSIDVRYGTHHEIHSHDHKSSPALVFNHESASDMFSQIMDRKPDKVIIDEVQFFDASVIKDLIAQLNHQGVDVIAAGLLYDYRRHPFGATSELIGLADASVELSAICQKCGALARHSERVQGSKQQIEVGETDKYIAACEKCHHIFQA